MQSDNRLVVYGIHLFGDKQHVDLRNEWEDTVRGLTRTKVPVTVEHRFIALSMTDIVSTNGQAYVKQMREVMSTLQTKPRYLTRHAGVSRKKINWKALRTRVKSGITKKSFERFMFIADELATWMVKEMMARQPDCWRSTVAVVFLSMQLDSTEDGSHGTISEYLNTLTKSFGYKTALKAWDEDGSDLSTELFDIDKKFFNMSPDDWKALEPISWKTKIKYDATEDFKIQRTAESRKIIKGDLQVLFNAAYRLVEDEAEMSEDRLIIENREKSRDDTMTSRRLGATQAYLPTSNPPTDVLESPMILTDEQLAFKDFRDRAEFHLGAGDLKSADRLLTTCSRILQEMAQPFADGQLEVGLLHSVVWLQLGDYCKARHRLMEAVEYATTLPLGKIPNSAHVRIREIQTQLKFRLATALMRLGNYGDARKLLKELIAAIDRGGDTVDQTRKMVILETFVGVNRLYSLNENYLGNFTEIEDDQHLKKARQVLQDAKINSKDNRILSVIELQMDFTNSKILVLQGQYKIASEALDNVYKRLKTRLGPNNILTLEAQVCLARIRVITSQPSAGESLLVEAKERILEHFSQDHPLALEAMSVSVTAYTAQGKVTEALGTSEYLCRRAVERKILGSTAIEWFQHPRAYEWHAQLSAAYVAAGNYQSAEDVLKQPFSLLVNSHQHDETNLLGENAENHNIGLSAARYLAHLARALLHVGKLQESEIAIRRGLETQIRFYMGVNLPATSLTALRAIIDCKVLEPEGGKYLQSVTRSSTMNLAHHPDILMSIDIVCELEARKGTSAPELVVEIRQSLYDRVGELFGDDSEIALRARLALGYVRISHAGMSTIEAERALEDFVYVLRQCAKRPHLRKDHPLALEARRELSIARTLISGMTDANARELFRTLKDIWESQRRKLGLSNPQTLQTMLFYLSSALVLDDPISERIKDGLLRQLGLDMVRHERLIEVALVKERLAQIYSEAGRLETSRQVLIGILQDLEPFQRGKTSADNPELWAIYQDTTRRAKRFLTMIDVGGVENTTSGQVLRDSGLGLMKDEGKDEPGERSIPSLEVSR